jgi:hypothetical protein
VTPYIPGTLFPYEQVHQPTEVGRAVLYRPALALSRPAGQIAEVEHVQLLYLRRSFHGRGVGVHRAVSPAWQLHPP